MKGPAPSDIESVRAALSGLLDDLAPGLVATYFTPSERFAGATFDTLALNPQDSFEASDVLAASLLDVPFLPRAVRSLLQDDAQEFAVLLSAVPAGVDLWDATDADLAHAQALWDRLTSLDGVGPTRTSKLMARKRPRLVPIVDRVVRQHLNLDGINSWEALRQALGGSDLPRRIEAVRPITRVVDYR